MIRKPVKIDLAQYPEALLQYLEKTETYDSSCSPQARVFFIDKDGGYYLKTAPKGTLKREALMTEFFAKKGLSARVVEYISADKDYMLTHRVPGEDCTFRSFLEQPERLCDIMAERLRWLHGFDTAGCPINDHMSVYCHTVEANYKNNIFDPSFLDESLEGMNARQAFEFFSERKGLLKSDTLLHGDYCLPNIMLNEDFSFSGFIDVGNGGVGDRHVDLFWGAWTLNYNLKTNKYKNRFFDAYGRNLVNDEIIKIVGVAECFG